MVHSPDTALIYSLVGFDWFTALRFLVFFLIFVWLPGSGITSFFAAPYTRLEKMSLSPVMGYAFICLVYSMTAHLGKESLFLPLIGCFAGLACIRLLVGRPSWDWTFPHLRFEHVLYGALILFKIAVIAIHCHQWTRIDEEGLKWAGNLYGDNLFVPALTVQMAYGLPPENPMMAGEAVHYHYFPYLPLLFFWKIFHFPLMSLHHFYLPAIAQFIFGLTVAAAAFRFFSHRGVRLFAFFFVFLVCTYEFKTGYLIGLAYFLWGSFLLEHYLVAGSKRYLVLGAFLMGSLISSQTLLALTAAPALIAFLGLNWIQGKFERQRVFWMVVCSLASFWLWKLYSFGDEQNIPAGGMVHFGIFITHPIRETIRSFSSSTYEFWLHQRDLMPKSLWGLLSSEMKPLRYVFVLGVWVLAFFAYFLSILDTALMGLGYTLQKMGHASKNILSSFAYDFMGLCGLVALACGIFLVWVEPDVNSTYFTFVHVLVIFYAAERIFQVMTGGIQPRWLRWLLLPLILYTISSRFLIFVLSWDRPPFYNLISFNRWDGYQFLKNHLSRRDIVIHPLVHDSIYSASDKKVSWSYLYHNYGFPIFTEGRSFFIRPNHVPNFSKNRLGGTEEQRIADWELFFKTETSDAAQGILERYGIDWVVDTPENRLKFKPSDRLKMVYENPEMRVFHYERKAMS